MSTWRPTADYDWSIAGSAETIRIEIKSLQDDTVLHKATFPMRIKKSVGKSMQHGSDTRKRFFLAHAGDHVVTTEVRNALRGYNRDNPERRIDRLWLLHHGQLEEIDLK